MSHRPSLVIPGYEDEELRVQLEEVEIDYSDTREGHFKGIQVECVTRRVTYLRDQDIEDYLRCAHEQHVPIMLQLKTGRVLTGYIEFSAETGQISVFATQGEVTKILTSLERIAKLILPA